MGLSDNATKLEITTAEARVIAVWVNKTPVIPFIKIKGIFLSKFFFKELKNITENKISFS